MVYPISVDEVQSRLSRISDNIFDGIKETFVGMNRQILNFIHEVFPVDALVLFLSAIPTKILFNGRSAVLANQSFLERFHFKSPSQKTNRCKPQIRNWQKWWMSIGSRSQHIRPAFPEFPLLIFLRYAQNPTLVWCNRLMILLCNLSQF